MKKRYTAKVKVNNDGRVYDLILSLCISSKKRAKELIEEFIERYKNTDLQVLESYIY